MTDVRAQISSKISEIAARFEAQEAWKQSTIILCDGTLMALERELSEEDSASIDAVFDLVRGDEDLRQFMIEELDANKANNKERLIEFLGWEPGMTLGTPDVPQEVVEKYTDVTFYCERCGSKE